MHRPHVHAIDKNAKTVFNRLGSFLVHESAMLEQRGQVVVVLVL